MGRGRAKAKQMKVARTVKYQEQGTDLRRLADELHGGPAGSTGRDEDDSRYSQWADYEPGERDSA